MVNIPVPWSVWGTQGYDFVIEVDFDGQLALCEFACAMVLTTRSPREGCGLVVLEDGQISQLRSPRDFCSPLKTALKPLGVSKKYGKTPKASILIGFSVINHPFWVPLFLETPIQVLELFLSQESPRRGVWMCMTQGSFGYPNHQ